MALLPERILVVGDVHVVPTELDDCEKLFVFLEQLCIEHKPTKIVFMGDQHHNFAFLHVAVMGFWMRWIARLHLLTGLTVFMLKGNHDMPGTESDLHTLMPYALMGVRVIDFPQDINGILYCPYFDKPEDLVKASAGSPEVKLMLCHQSFDGSRYENGFYVKDGVDPQKIVQKQVLSGHIHTGQTNGKVWYVGAPRWRTESDANVDRNVFLLEVQDGAVQSFLAFSTGGVCRRIIRYEDSETEPWKNGLDADFAKDDVRIDITGTAVYCQARAKELRVSLPGVKLRTSRTDVLKLQVRESEGVDTAFWKFFAGWQPPGATDKERLAGMAKERLRL